MFFFMLVFVVVVVVVVVVLRLLTVKIRHERKSSACHRPYF